MKNRLYILPLLMLFLIVAPILNTSASSLSESDYLFSTSHTSDYWTDINHVMVTDGQYAYTLSSSSSFLNTFGYNTDLSGIETINGVEVIINCANSGIDESTILNVELSWYISSNHITTSGNYVNVTTNYPNYVNYSAGNSTDLWGEDALSADVFESSFDVQITCSSVDSGIRIDSIGFRVFYDTSQTPIYYPSHTQTKYWDRPYRVNANDTSNAWTTVTNQNLVCFGYDFGSISGYIYGIEVRTKIANYFSSKTSTAHFEIVWNNLEQMTTTDYSITTTESSMSGNYDTISFGGPSDTWGRGQWLESELTAQDFGVKVWCSSTNDILTIDYIAIKIYCETISEFLIDLTILMALVPITFVGKSISIAKKHAIK